MTKPLISIVIDNYNYAGYVGRAIESALAQPEELREVIVVDDGSTDNSRSIIDGYASQAQLIYQENRGQGSAFNAGYQASQGEIVVFLDSDDLLLPNAAEELAKLHAAGIDWVKAVWQMQEVGPSDTFRNALNPTQPPDEGDRLQHTVAKGPLSVHSSPTSGNAWHRSYLEKVMPLPEVEYARGPDGYLLMLAAVYGRIHRVDIPLSCYRVHGSNFLASKSEFQKMDTLRQRNTHACRILAEHLEKLGIPHDPTKWRHNHWDQLTQLADDLQANIPLDAKLILVDEDALNVGQKVFGRERYHLLGNNNAYLGPPATSSEAIQQIEARREQGVRYVAFMWYAFWWLEHYTQLRDWLDTHGTRTVYNERCVIYELNQGEK